MRADYGGSIGERRRGNQQHGLKMLEISNGTHRSLKKCGLTSDLASFNWLHNPVRE